MAFDTAAGSGRVYQSLRQDILNGLFPPGARLSDPRCPALVGGRRASRAALPARRVRRRTVADCYLEAFQFHAIFERAAVDAVVAAALPLSTCCAHVETLPPAVVGDTHANYVTYIHHDQAFHQMLIDAVDNRMLSERFAEHQAILTAIAAGDAAAARAAIDGHLHRASDYLVRLADAAAREKKIKPGDLAQHLSRAKNAKVAATGTS